MTAVVSLLCAILWSGGLPGMYWVNQHGPPMPYALCPVPYALCPMPYALPPKDLIGMSQPIVKRTHASCV